MNAKELRAMDEAALKKELADLMQAHFKLFSDPISISPN